MRRWIRVVLTSCVAVGVAGFAAGIPLADRTPECVRAAQWVTAHANELPTTLDELVKHPRSVRIAVFNAISYEKRSELWHDQLNRFLASRSLTDEQVSVVKEALRMITPAMYKGRVEGMTPEEARHHEHEHVEFARRATAAFDKQTIRVFGELGWVIAPIKQETSKRFGIVPASFAKRFDECECNVDVDFCAMDCRSDIGECGPTQTGCGWFNCSPCNGKCLPWTSGDDVN